MKGQKTFLLEIGAPPDETLLAHAVIVCVEELLRENGALQFFQLSGPYETDHNTGMVCEIRVPALLIDKESDQWNRLPLIPQIIVERCIQECTKLFQQKCTTIH